MEKVLVFSDLHIREEGEAIAGLDPLVRFRTALEHALARHGDAECLVLLGDLTHAGKRSEYRRLKTLLDRVTIPIVPCLGNHDRREAFQAVFPDAPQIDSGHVQAVRDLDRHRLITLDTLDGPPYKADAHGGRLCPARTAMLRHALETAGDRLPLVFSHHPAAKTGLVALDEIRLQDGRALLDLLAAHPGAHLVSGHLHRLVSGSSRGVPYTILTSTCHQNELDFVGEAFGPVTDGPGAYGVIGLRKNGVTVHMEPFGTGARPFGPGQALP
jgi:Predicted phosphohydrolases